MNTLGHVALAWAIFYQSLFVLMSAWKGTTAPEKLRKRFMSFTDDNLRTQAVNGVLSGSLIFYILLRAW